MNRAYSPLTLTHSRKGRGDLRSECAYFRPLPLRERAGVRGIVKFMKKAAQ